MKQFMQRNIYMHACVLTLKHAHTYFGDQSFKLTDYILKTKKFMKTEIFISKMKAHV